MVDGATVAPRGAFVHGRVAKAKQAGNLRGSSELSIEFTDLMIDDQLFEIFTSGLTAQTGNEAGKTVRRTARASTVGRLAGGKKGARTGLKVGAAASVLTVGTSINVPAGTIVETRLAQELRIQQ